MIRTFLRYTGIGLVATLFLLPFYIMIRNSLMATNRQVAATDWQWCFPAEIEEAGRLDGLGHLGVYARLALPNSTTVLASLGALSFIDSWNAFLWPLVIGQDPSSWTVQIALSTFLTAQTVNLPGLFAGAVVTILPLVVMFLAAQRHIVQGITMSGLKG